MRSLDRLLRPKSIAVIGGGFFGTNVVRQCLKAGFAGDVWPVHPAKSEIAGVAAFPSVADLPGAPDAAFVGVNRHLTVDIVRELAARGAGGAVCFASGFLESGGEGADLQADLVAAAADMPIVGPNCYGFINYADGALLWPDQHGGRRLEDEERGVAILTQSSNIAINMTMQKRGLPVAYLATAGNQAQTGLSDMALALIEDSRVSALGIHIEAFDSIAGFERLASRARKLHKPVVAIKAGRSEQAQAATVSHTASLAGSDGAADAFLKRLGMACVHTIPSFLETLKLLHVHGPLPGGALSSMSCSGGEASLMADAAEGREIRYPALTNEQRARVAATLGPLVAVSNPLDYHTFIWNDEPAMTATFSAMASGGFDLNMLVLDFPRGDRCSDADWWPAVNAFQSALEANDARGSIVASMPENLSEAHALRLMQKGIAPLAGIAEALDAAEAAAVIGTAWRKEAAGGVFTPPSALSGISPSRGEMGGGDLWDQSATPVAVAPTARPHPIDGEMSPKASEGGIASSDAVRDASGARRVLDEHQAKARLAEAGLDVPPGRRVETANEAVAAAIALGFPVALKALGVAHKSEHGAVRLNLDDPEIVRIAAREMSSCGTGLYIERMIAGGVAELIVGVTRDPIFGPVMTLGSGGVLVELLRDSRTLLLPTTREDVEQALRGLRLFPLLGGYRGRPKGDIAAAIDAILGIARFAVDNAEELEELDINPLVVCAEGKGAWIADALMVVAIGEADRGGVAGDRNDISAVFQETPSARFAGTSPSTGRKTRSLS